MMITNNSERKLEVWTDGPASDPKQYVIIREREAFIKSAGESRRKWSDDRVSVTLPELRKIIQKLEEEEGKENG